ncbi:MAG: carbamoyltransferase, partial [Actinomycetes bacterium]
MLGISCDLHDAAAALVVDGEVVAAAEEERFSRDKHDASLPERALLSCLATGEVDLSEVDAVVFHEKPFVSAARVLATRQRVGPRGVAPFVRGFPDVVGHNMSIRRRIDDVFRRHDVATPTVAYSEHHVSHASAAFFPSPFESAAILTLDGLGEWSTASFGVGRGQHIDLMAEQRFPDSIGLLYSLGTVWCGFEANDGEYKLMGLAPFGEPRYLDALRSIADPLDDGSVHVNARGVRWWSGRVVRSARLRRLLDGPHRRPGDEFTQRDADLARSVQVLAETVVLRSAEHVHARTGERQLVLAGGVGLNCFANARLLAEGPFDDVWVQPAAGDAGSALGAALWYWHHVADQPRPRRADGDAMRGAALGPSFSTEEIDAWLQAEGIASRRVEDAQELATEVAGRLADGACVGWFQGRMEFGPRALGHRSILADPRRPDVQRDLNLRVKGRESFRPFAPAVLWDHAADWFEIDRPAPYMTFVHRVRSEQLVAVADEPTSIYERVQTPRSTIPACTHVDGTARVQTVDSATHPQFAQLLEAFRDRTGCPVLLNTSFNRAGEPVVCTPDDAYRTAIAAGLDLLVLEDHLIDLTRVED